jgi:predicted Zn-dependent peptidase
LYVRAGVDVNKTAEALKVVLAEMQRLKSDPVPEDELIKAKENLKGNLYLGLEDSLSVAEFLADQQLLWGSIDQPEQIVDEIMKVTTDDIMKVSEELFVTEKLNLAVVGPYKREDRFVQILKI